MFTLSSFITYYKTKPVATKFGTFNQFLLDQILPNVNCLHSINQILAKGLSLELRIILKGAVILLAYQDITPWKTLS